MSTHPPPHGDPPLRPPPPPSPAAPPAYGYVDEGPQGRSGMAVASLVLSLVGLLPFFWILQIPGLLGLIFGVIGMRQTRGHARPGRGLAIAGLVIGIVLVALAALLIAVIASGECEIDDTGFRCDV